MVSLTRVFGTVPTPSIASSFAIASILASGAQAQTLCNTSSNYCTSNPNSTGSAAVISSNDLCVIAENQFVLSAAPVPDQTGLFFYAANQNNGGAGTPFGNGILCAGTFNQPIFRLPVEVAQNNVLSHAINFPSIAPPAQITVGSTWNFQAWFRDPDDGGSFFNLSDGLNVLFANPSTPDVQFTATASSVGENRAAVLLQVELSAASAVDVLVPFTVTGVTASSPDDFNGSPGDVVIPAGLTSIGFVVGLQDDALSELDETFEVALGAPTNANLGANVLHTVTIIDDDPLPSITFEDAGDSVLESGDPITVVVRLSKASGQAVSADLGVSGTATQGPDFTLSATSLVIQPGDLTASVTLAPADDLVGEPDETVILTLQNLSAAQPGGVLVFTATILDDEGVPTVEFTSAGATVNEAIGVADPIVALSWPTSVDVTVPFSVAGSASGADYSVGGSPVVIPAGDMSVAVSLVITNDTTDEPDETIVLSLGTPTNADLGAQVTHSITVQDDDPRPVITLTTVSQSIGEDGISALVFAELSEVSGWDVSATFNVLGTATDLVDFSIPEREFIIPPGFLSVPIRVNLVDDAFDELDETVVIRLESGSHSVIGAQSQHTVTILDNDPQPSVQFTGGGQTAAEGTDVVATVQLSAPSGLDVTLPYVIGGDAQAGADYEVDPLSASPLVILAGETSVDIQISLLTDADEEPDETVSLTLSGPTNAALGATAEHVITIEGNTLTGIVSDDFNRCEGLLPEWTFYNASGDGTFSVSGVGTDDALLNLTVPGESDHDPSGPLLVPHVAQAANDVDFEVEVKFDTLPDENLTIEGVLAKEDVNNWARFDLFHDGDTLKFFAGSTTSGQPVTTWGFGDLGKLEPPLWVRVSRAQDLWSFSFSEDSQTFQPLITDFQHALVLSEVGLYSGNGGGDGAPEHTARVDYFFETQSPVVPEDGPFAGAGPFTLTIVPPVGGTVDVDPPQPEYFCTDVVTLMATADLGFELLRWEESGVPIGTENPIQVLMDGDKSIEAIFLEDMDPPVIGPVTVTVTATTAEFSWTTDEPATSRVDWGADATYGMFLEDLALVTDHTLLATGLTPDTLYHFSVTSADAVGQSSSTPDDTFMTDPTSGIVSDDFNRCEGLIPEWTYYNGSGDGTFSFSGVGTDDALVNLSVPGGTSHDASGTLAVPHLAQAANDVDFELEVKFDTLPDSAVEIQGLLMKQDADNYARFDLFHDGNSLQFFAGNVANGASVSTWSFGGVGPLTAPAWVRVSRTQDFWTFSSSDDGQAFQTHVAAFQHALVVTEVGVYAGNSTGAASPPHTAGVDYLFDTQTPVVPEDGPFAGAGPFTLTIVPAAGGTVDVDPLQPEYFCTDVVTLTATADLGFELLRWEESGVPIGTENPIQVLMDGDKSVEAIFLEDTNPPVIGPVTVTVTATTAEFSWTTDEPATSRVDWGADATYGMFLEDLALVTDHTLLAIGLTPDTLYHFSVTSADGLGQSSSTPDDTFMTDPTPGIVSDDFNRCEGLGAFWTFVDGPLGDGVVSVGGAGTDDALLMLSVPGGQDHEAFGTITVPRLVQSVNNVDFELEMKFESDVTEAFQIQGALIEEGALDWIRADFYSDGSNMRLFVGTTVGGTTSQQGDVLVGGSGPTWMQITRQGDDWTVSWSQDGGQSWQVAASFTHVIAPVTAGLYVGNSAPGGNLAPAHTAIVDFFVETGSPLTVEDGPIPGGGPFSLTTNVTGSGSITVDPVLPEYFCTDTVELLAVPDFGWEFDRWEGDASGSVNPLSLPMDEDKTITAVFVADVTAPTISNVDVSVGTTFVTVTWETDEPATSRVDFGEQLPYTAFVSSAALVTQHVLSITGLPMGTNHHFQLTSGDQLGQASSTTDDLFRTATVGDLISDDFNRTNLVLDTWSYGDAVGGGAMKLLGTGSTDARLVLSVPGGGLPYTPWIDNEAVHVFQAASDVDFELEVKFESDLFLQNQIQGIFVEQDAGTWIRFDFNYSGSGVDAYHATFAGGTPANGSTTSVSSGPWSGGMPLYMRVRRVANDWFHEFSFDGSSWMVTPALNFPLNVTKVGVFCGNEGANPPAHSALVDYAFNTNEPILNEDWGSPIDELPPFAYRRSAAPVSSTEVDVSWGTDEESLVYLEYGTTPAYGSRFPRAGTLPLSFGGSTEIGGLLPDTTYHFRVVADDAAQNGPSFSGDFEVTTFPDGFTGLPEFTIWYGQEEEGGVNVQRFGHLGSPQTWVNVLGNVQDLGGEVASLSYTLNGGGPQPLSMGALIPEPWRLTEVGDFNVEINRQQLGDGINVVEITATDDDGNSATKTVHVDYDSSVVGSLPYSVDWSLASDLQDFVQVVDGKWIVQDDPNNPGGKVVRNEVMGYDRLIAIGDDLWTDYEVTIPVLVHELDPNGFTPGSNSHAVGMILRWTGHTPASPVQQPQVGFWPIGALISYRWFPTIERWHLYGNEFHVQVFSSQNPLILGVQYVIKARVETQVDGTSLYRMKVWEAGQTEPAGWFLELTTDDIEPNFSGSLLLVAHHVDVSFGNVSIVPLD